MKKIGACNQNIIKRIGTFVVGSFLQNETKRQGNLPDI